MLLRSCSFGFGEILWKSVRALGLYFEISDMLFFTQDKNRIYYYLFLSSDVLTADALRGIHRKVYLEVDV